MIKDKKAKWVKALRSGRYKQTTGMLQDHWGANCCLGVLCRVLRLPAIKGSDHTGFQGSENPDIVDFCRLPRPVKQQLGITDAQEDNLIEMNDKWWSFKEIADWIEDQL